MHDLCIEVLELDIRRDRKCDFTLPYVQERWLRRIDSGEFWAVVVTPPCSTFSRAQFANDQGPHPVRSHLHPRGFSWNSQARHEKATLGNLMADFSFEAMRRQARLKHRLAFMEQPEDLGQTTNPRIPGHRPASMWQFPQFEAAMNEGLRTAAFSQLDFGSESNKPTRFLMKFDGQLHEAMYEGLPHFPLDEVFP